MYAHEKRQIILRQIRNSLVAVAKNKDTVSVSKLIGEICLKYEVSQRTAKNYINEIVIMGLARKEGDLLWYKNEEDIQMNYLHPKQEEIAQET